MDSKGYELDKQPLIDPAFLYMILLKKHATKEATL